jgi:ribosome recycling factor
LSATGLSKTATRLAEELKTKVDELRTLIVEKLAELEDEPKWGSEEEREELADALEELSDQAVVMRDMLREEE